MSYRTCDHLMEDGVYCNSPALGGQRSAIPTLIPMPGASKWPGPGLFGPAGRQDAQPDLHGHSTDANLPPYNIG